MSQLIPSEVIDSIALLESYVFPVDPRKIAKTICYIKASAVPLEALAFFPDVDQNILAKIHELGIDRDLLILPGRSARANHTYWIHALAPLGAYLHPNEKGGLHYKLYEAIASLIPGVDLKEAKRRLRYQACPHLASFFYSMGGNVLEDALSGKSDEQELVLDYLGLRIAEWYILENNQRLSFLLQRVNDPLVVGEAWNFRGSEYYRIAVECFTPSRFLLGLFSRLPRPLNLGVIRLDEIL